MMTPEDIGAGDATAAKAALRRSALVRRAEAHAVHRAAASAALTVHLGQATGRTVAGYLPIRSEADPVPAMTALAPHNRICVPVIAGAGLPLRFREWRPGCALTEGPFRVAVPAEGAWLVPDLLIVPLVAWDPGLNRLGYGGGFYDRTLAELRRAAPVEAVGFAYSSQRETRVPQEETDAPLDRIVTETGVITR